MKLKLLAAFAHPDDEAFATGGTLARYAAQGVEVTLVCATRGEAGEISDPSLATPETLGQVREAELRCAAENMGIAELIFLGYRDSGMAGTPENDDLRAFVNAPAVEVVSRLVGLIRQIRPQVVLTFEPNGHYGHPDHIAIHRHMVAAFHAAADPNRFLNQGPVWQPQRLFYSAVPRSFFVRMIGELQSRGEDTSEFDDFEDPQTGWPDEKITVEVDVSATVEAKWTALQCHRTQFGPGNLFRRLPESMVKTWMSREYFSLAWDQSLQPHPQPGLRLSGLFAGLEGGIDG